jgi:hypothetical protein
MKSLLSEIIKELTDEQQKTAGAIDITKIEDEIVNDLVSQDIVSFEIKDYDNDQKIQNNQ